MAMRIAAIPDGTVFSPNTTNPLPTPSRSPPTIAESRTWRLVGQWRASGCRMRSHPTRRSPASANRIAAIRNGGIVLIAIAIPKYVDPQMTYTMPRLSQSARPRARFGAGAAGAANGPATGVVLGIVCWSKEAMLAHEGKPRRYPRPMPARPIFDAAERRRRIGARHFLASEARAIEPVGVADALVGIHATDPASVYLGLRARVRDLTHESLATDLYDRRSLLKVLGMRRTMFVA